NASSSNNSQPDPDRGGDVPQLNSTLSATAKEFYPRGYGPSPVENNYEPHFTEVMQEVGNSLSYDVSSQSYQRDSVDIALNQISEIVDHLTLNPGRFDDLIHPLTETFKTWLSDVDICYFIVDMIVEQSFVEPNFRYTGARLCSYLSNEFGFEEENIFRRMLLNRCRDEHEMTISHHSIVCPERLRGYTLFIAELFMQLEVRKGCSDRIAILGIALIEGLLLLLSEPNSEDIKCVCQVLKLTGRTLDMQNPLNMNPVIHKLALLANNPTLEANIQHLINNVVHLRELGWGEPSNVMSKSTTTQQYNSNSNEPVFYGPDGQVITPEESQFLEENFRQFPDDDYDDFGEDGELLVPSEEMDEEHRAAFEQFLKMGKNQIN
ncbi:hypothetical protein L9F63_018988, partial [Diploptera punctata]